MTIKYRKLVNGDYELGKNQQNFITGTAAVAQAISTRLKLFTGEWWEDTEDGLPVFESIIGTAGSAENIRAIDLLIRERILNTQDVIDIKEFSSTYNNRRYTVQCTVESKYGDVIVEEVIF